MTFDEALEVLANSENNKSVKEGQLEYGLYRAYDVVSVLQNLRKQYAPIVEMTKEQANYLKSLVIDVSKEFDEDELPSDGSIKTIDKMIELDSGYLVLRYMNAILHPETIKIVDE